MKRLLIFFVILTFTLSLVSCKENSKVNYLSYQAYPFDAHGILTFDGTEYEVFVTVQRAGDIILKFVKPEALSNMIFELNEGKVTVKTGNVTQTLNDGGYSASEGILLAAQLFSISGKSFSGAGIITENGVKYNVAEYKVKNGNVSVYIQNGLSFPEKLKATLNGHEFTFLFMNE